MSRLRDAGSVRGAGRLAVARVLVEPAQVWFHCPRCDEALEGYGIDPRGRDDISCEACGERFDIPSTAALVIAGPESPAP